MAQTQNGPKISFGALSINLNPVEMKLVQTQYYESRWKLGYAKVFYRKLIKWMPGKYNCDIIHIKYIAFFVSKTT